jgi:hypothetical protein
MEQPEGCNPPFGAISNLQEESLRMNDKQQSKISQEEEKLLRISYEESYASSLDEMLSEAIEFNKSLAEIVEDVRRKWERITELEEKYRRLDKEDRLRCIRRQQRWRRQEQANQAKIQSKLISFPPSRGSPCLQGNYTGLQRDESRTEKEGVILISQVKSKGSAAASASLAR